MSTSAPSQRDTCYSFGDLFTRLLPDVMGGQQSAPQFDYLHDLLENGGPSQTVEIKDPDQPANASAPRRHNAAENGLITIPYLSQTQRAPGSQTDSSGEPTTHSQRRTTRPLTHTILPVVLLSRRR